MTREEALNKAINIVRYFEAHFAKSKEAREDAVNIIEALEQEPCEDEYIKIPKKALKYRTTGMVAYNVEWLKNHFDIERTIICGAQQPCEDAISRKAVLSYIYNDLGLGDEENGADIERQKELESSYRYVKSLPPIIPPQPKTVLYSGDGYADGYMVYDMAECPNCGYEYEDGDKDWGLSFCPNCGQKLTWESEE